MNILVTGGAGFIGSHVCDALIAQGHGVLCVDNLLLGKRENVAHLFVHDRFSFVEHDIRDKTAMDPVFAKGQFNVVFHLAANSDIAQSFADPSVDYQYTFETTYRTLELMKKHAVRQIVFASTSAVYGEAQGQLSEDCGPLLPVSHYGAAKLASEAFISSFVANYGFQAWIARFPNVVGERGTHGVIVDFIGKLRQNPDELEVLGNGEQYKPYLYVTDLVDALCFLWKHAQEPLNLYNIGVDSRTRVKDIAHIVAETMGFNPRIRYTGGDRGWIGDVPEFQYDLSKIHNLGWRSHMSSDEAVKKAAERLVGAAKRGCV